MTYEIRIIETDTIEANDMVAFTMGAQTRAGIVIELTDAGLLSVNVAGIKGPVMVAHEDVTDILPCR
jgi:ABC-type enterobactin transport system permease subunit